MDLHKYLDRVRYRGDCRPDFDTLVALHQAHVCSVPFENIDVQLGLPLTTDVENAYQKIVTRHRGGWCYEQNGLFGSVLREIGFEVTRVAASVMRQDCGAAADSNHLCLLVQPPGSGTQYLVDVGFGGSMLRPIEFKNASEHQVPFHIGLRKVADAWWRFWETTGEDEFTYDFLPAPASEQALSEKCRQLQTQPASNFVLNLVVQLRSPNQHKILRGKVFTTLTAAGSNRQLLESADALVELLITEFHLDVPEVASIWPTIERRHLEVHADNGGSA